MSKTTSTHIVLKIEDCKKYLNPMELQELFSIISKIGDSRHDDGKPTNYYAVVNLDEPYIDLVMRVIDQGEKTKAGGKNQNDR